MQAHFHVSDTVNSPLVRGLLALLLWASILLGLSIASSPAAAQREWLPTLGFGYAYDATEGSRGHGSLVSGGSETRWLNGLSVGIHSGVRLLGFPEGAASRHRIGIPLDINLGYALDIITLVPSVHAGFSSNLDLGAGTRAQAGLHGTAMLAYAVNFDHRVALAATYRHWLLETPAPGSGPSPSGALSHSLDISLRWIWVLW